MPATAAAALLCFVVSVADGDTLTARCGLAGLFRSTRVRIAAIDAPERRQAFGSQSRQNLVNLCLKKTARITVLERDRYGRSVATVRCQGQDVSTAQVQAGLAWVYTAYAQDFPELVPLERQARQQRLGLWSQSRPIPPWQYRVRYKKFNSKFN